MDALLLQLWDMPELLGVEAVIGHTLIAAGRLLTFCEASSTGLGRKLLLRRNWQ